MSGRLWKLLTIAAGVGLLVCLWALVQTGSDTVEPVFSVQEERLVPAATERQESTGEASKPSVQAPIDFKALQVQNPDIYAWIQIPGTAVDYPVLQHFGDDTYYLYRDVEGNNADTGSLYTEYQYNTTDFSDPLTIIYGHNMRDGSMFGSLQTHSETLVLDENAVFYIYQPERKLTYRIFAAVPYDNRHILYYNDFKNEYDYTRFFEEIYATRSLYANLDPDSTPAFGEQVVILSTCLRGDNAKRFLVLGLLTGDVTLR